MLRIPVSVFMACVSVVQGRTYITCLFTHLLIHSRPPSCAYLVWEDVQGPSLGGSGPNIDTPSSTGSRLAQREVLGAEDPQESGRW